MTPRPPASPLTSIPTDLFHLHKNIYLIFKNNPQKSDKFQDTFASLSYGCHKCMVPILAKIKISTIK